MTLFKNLVRSNSLKRFMMIEPYLMGKRYLDVGAAEGWIGDFAHKRLHLDVTLVDVVDLNQTELDLVLYDGSVLPFNDKSFDTVSALLTLHHCDNPEQVLSELIRVAKKRILITESVYHNSFGKLVLELMDGGFNSLRSSSKISKALHFKKSSTWRALFKEMDLKIEYESWLSRGLHQQKLFVLGVDKPKKEAT